MKVKLVTPPSIEPITYDQVMDHLRIITADATTIAYINTLITAVRQDVEDLTNRKLITQTWKYYLDQWPDKDYIEVPFPPLQSVTSIIQFTADDLLADLTEGSYLVDTDSEPGRIVLAHNYSWPTETLYPANPIEIQFVCGYGLLATDVPAKIRQAMLLQIADLFENRQTIVQGQSIQHLDTYERLLASYRIFWI
jgi:uncharacterized phiE125 gp8 family phage protein